MPSMTHSRTRKFSHKTILGASISNSSTGRCLLSSKMPFELLHSLLTSCVAFFVNFTHSSQFLLPATFRYISSSRSAFYFSPKNSRLLEHLTEGFALLHNHHNHCHNHYDYQSPFLPVWGDDGSLGNWRSKFVLTLPPLPHVFPRPVWIFPVPHLCFYLL